MELSNVIYLDNAFIVEAYEKTFAKDAPTKYSKTTDVSLGFDFIAKAGASLKETFEYPINTHAMYRQLHEQLNKIEEIVLSDSNIRELPDLFWMEGLFGVSSASSNKDNITRYIFSAAPINGGKNLLLATNDVYFSSGYDQLLSLAPNFTNQGHL